MLHKCIYSVEAFERIEIEVDKDFLEVCLRSLRYDARSVALI